MGWGSFIVGAAVGGLALVILSRREPEPQVQEPPSDWMVRPGRPPVAEMVQAIDLGANPQPLGGIGVIEPQKLSKPDFLLGETTVDWDV